MILLGWAGCSVGPPSDAVYLRLRGDVAPDVVVDGREASAMLVWVTVADGNTCVEVDELPFVPHLFSYEVEIVGPPALDGDPCVPSSADLEEPEAFAVGVVVLIDPEPGSRVEVSADPHGLLSWFTGTPGSLADRIGVTGGRLAAAAEGFALIVARDDIALPEPYCRFDSVIGGLVLYDDRGTGCGGWVPLSEPGGRTEIQGVDLVRPADG